eukprot:303242_1
MNARRLCITSFICGNKKNKYHIRMTHDENDCDDTKENGDLVYAENKFDGMIIAAWYHTKNEFQFNSTIKFKLDNCLPAVGFDYNRFLMRKRDKFFGQNAIASNNTHSDGTR